MTIPSVKLSSGYGMPLVGFGIWKVPRDSAADQVYNAIKLGYRHIDGAWDYTNSAEAGQGVRKAISDGLVKREDLFITSKLWNNYHKREHAIEQAKAELEAWGLDYLDLFLIHFPVSLEYIPISKLRWPCFWTDESQSTITPLAKVPLSETWGALESLVKTKENPSGIFRSIGVSNMHNQLVGDLLSYANIPPAVLQIEHHPYLTQPDLVKFAQEHNIAVTGYSTFGPTSFIELDNARAKSVAPLFEVDVIKKIAEKHGKSPSQVLLRWCTQRDIIVIPKSNSVERLKQNLEHVNFDLDKDELEQISKLDIGLRFNDPATLPGSVDKPLRIFS